MNTPVPPLFDRLTVLTQTILDDTARKNWTEIEDLEKEQGAPQTADRRGPSGPAAAAISSGSGPILPARPPAGDPIAPRPPVFDSEPDAPAPVRDTVTERGVATDAADVEPGFEQGFETPSAGSRPAQPEAGKSSPQWHSVSEAGPTTSAASPASSPAHAVSAAAAGIEHSLATSGPLVAAQKLHAAIRSMSPEQVSAILDTAGGTVAAILEQAIDTTERSGKAAETGDRQADMRTALVIAHVAAVIDKDPRNPASIRLMQDICAIVLSPATPNDNATFAGLAQSIGIGAGSRMALAVAAGLADREDDPSRAQALLTLVLSGFLRLAERIDAAYLDLVQQAGPLCLDWIGWRRHGREPASRALAAFLKSRPDLLPMLEPQLERLDQAGLEAFRALRDLSSSSLDRRLGDIHRRYLENPSVFAAIAASRTALRDIGHLAQSLDAAHDGPQLEMIRLTLTQVGFDAPRAAFLADRTRLGEEALMLGSNWTELESFAEMEAMGRGFQRLLAFLDGQYVVAETPDIVSFDDSDMQL